MNQTFAWSGILAAVPDLLGWSSTASDVDLVVQFRNFFRDLPGTFVLTGWAGKSRSVLDVCGRECAIQRVSGSLEILGDDRYWGGSGRIEEFREWKSIDELRQMALKYVASHQTEALPSFPGHFGGHWRRVQILRDGEFNCDPEKDPSGIGVEDILPGERYNASLEEPNEAIQRKRHEVKAALDKRYNKDYRQIRSYERDLRNPALWNRIARLVAIYDGAEIHKDAIEVDARRYIDEADKVIRAIQAN